MTKSRSAAGRMMLKYLKHIDRYHSDYRLATDIADNELGEQVVKDLREGALKSCLIKQVGESLELTAQGKHFLPDPARNL